MTMHEHLYQRDHFIFTEKLDLGGEGLRVAIKDTIDIAGHRTVAGSRALLEAAPAAAHAEVVGRVLAAGCRIVGKAALHELAFGVTGINDGCGTPINPKFPDLVPGGSSSGSAAAVAAGLADFSLGTDTGGSIRIPAACCGVFGLKPSFGRISRRHVYPEQTSLDCVGPLAASIEQLERAMTIIDPTFRPMDRANVRIGIVQVVCKEAIGRSVHMAVARTGLPFQPVKLNGLERAFHAGLSVISFETFQAFGHLLSTGLLGSDIEARLRKSGLIMPPELQEAEATRHAFRAELDRLFETVDILCLPTLAVFPPTIAAARSDPTATGLTNLVRPFNLSGHPALAVPIASSGAGPISLQIVGRPGQDELVCAAARGFSGV